jgi:hypothetical protein
MVYHFEFNTDPSLIHPGKINYETKKLDLVHVWINGEFDKITI